MDYDRIILELLNRIAVLEDKVTALEQGEPAPTEKTKQESSKKYRFLADYLYSCGEASVQLTFAQIEDIIKTRLPDSARNHRAFWANTTSHSIALSWLNAGYQTVEVNLTQCYIVFEKQRRA